MMLLTPDLHARPRIPTVVLFGAGLIGSAIVTSLQKSSPLKKTSLELDWSQPELFREQLGGIEQQLTDLVGRGPDTETPRAVRVVWSAGRAGFQATDDEVSKEYDRFDEVVCCVERLSACIPEASWTVILISSAGGLFEGQQHVGLHSTPVPLRPYSHLKLRQEQRLQQCPGVIRKKIYRPTSVYGYVRNHQRRGLIPTLIADGIRQRASRISGFPTTLRDYVWIEDIAAYLAKVILDDDLCNQDSVDILGSAKPSSIFEIQQIVERCLRRPLYLCFATPTGNGNHITFATDVLPGNWTSSELETNVRKITAEALTRQAVFSEAP